METHILPVGLSIIQPTLVRPVVILPVVAVVPMQRTDELVEHEPEPKVFGLQRIPIARQLL